MAGAPYTSVKYNAREQILTSDLNRQQRLASREVQDMLAALSASDDARSGSPQNGGQGNPIGGCDLPPVMSAAGAFTMTLQYGQGYLQDFGISGASAGADDSQYEVVRWAQTLLTFANPDAGLPRIDLVQVTPGTADTNSSSRNLIVDPVARVITAATMNKKTDPFGVVAVVTGTPAAQPVAPAIVGNALALMEVYVPAAAPDSTTFSMSRRIWRLSVGVMASYHGVVRNCVLGWTLDDELATSAVLTIAGGVSARQINKVVIDGEMLVFEAASSSGPATLPGVVQDSLNNPFGVAASATHDVVYYVYACGGRNMPQGSRATSTGSPFQPIQIVESLTPPYPDGRPTAAIRTPRGDTQEGALYIGCGWVVKGTTRRKSCRVAGDWVYGATGQNVPSSNFVGFNEAARTLAAASTSQTLNSKPSLSTMALVGGLYANSNAGASSVSVGREAGAGPTFYAAGQFNSINGTVDAKEFHTGLTSSILKASSDPNFATATFYLWAKGYNMLVPRLSE